MKKTLLFTLASCLVLGVCVFAEDTTTGATSTGDITTLTTTSVTADEATTCMTTAIQTRDAAIKTAMDTYYASRTSAFTARTTAFTDALLKATKKEKKAALTDAWKIYKKAIQDARNIKKTQVTSAWKDYRSNLKSCKGDTAKTLMQERGTDDLND
jgi:IS1 family transposase